MTEYVPQTMLITGVAGFIASNFLEFVCEKYPKCKIYGIDKLNYCSNREFIREFKHPNFEFICDDINSINHSTIPFDEIDTVVHFAANTHVNDSFFSTMSFIHDNITATAHLADLCKQHVKRFIHISTDEVYGNKDTESDENTPMNPSNPYAATKASAEMLLSTYQNSFGFPLIITRGNNTYGSRQYFDKVVPTFVHRLLSGEKCQIHGNGENKRSFLHVFDTCNAIDYILRLGSLGSIYNIASNDEFTTEELANKIISIIKPEQNVNEWKEYVKDRKHNDIRYKISSTPLENLGWKQNIKFDEGIRRTIQEIQMQ